MKNKRYGIFLSAIAIASMLLSSLPETAYADENDIAQAGESAALDGEDVEGNAVKELKKVEISNADELIYLSQKSTAEAYTFGKEFILTDDIDLSGKEFKPVSMMAGTFNGNSHKITGFELNTEASESGFIRSVAKTGVVMDLAVEGYIAPKGSMKNIGGIAGINYGTIENCKFYGSILAKEAAGGIVGRNMASANIIVCTNEASVAATRRTGGIAGYNEGVIAGCVNNGEVNSTSKSASEKIEDMKSERKAAAEEEDSDGENENLNKLNLDNLDLKDDDLLERFEDEHKVNYTGGIAGVSKGTITDCTNNAKVGFSHLGYNTGGIVGYERGILYECENKGKVYGRKNIGGIAGEFEPYAQNIYGDDSIDEARDDIDDLVDMTATLNDKIGVEDDRTQMNIDAVRYSMDDLRDRIKEWKEYYRCKDDSVERDLRGRVDEIRDLVNDLDMDIKNGKAEKAMDAIQSDMGKMYKMLEEQAAFANQIDQIYPNPSSLADDPLRAVESKAVRSTFNDTMQIEQFKNLNPVVEDIIKQSDILIDYAEHELDEADDLKDDLEDLRELGNNLDDFLRGVYDDYKNEFRKTDDDLTARIDAIDILMDNLADGLKDSDKIIRDQLDRMVSQMKSVNRSIDEGFDEVDAEFARLRDTDDFNEIFDDVSDSDDTAPGLGKILTCVNNGAVDADINGGGIAGNVDIDTDLNSDFEVVSGGNLSLNYDRTQRATILKCINRAPVTVKNDYAGGIAGRADIGAIIKCENYASVLTDEGDYAGGIVGKSGYLARNNYSMAVIDGNDYVGGIAGEGYVLSGNYAMVTVDMTGGEKRGSIAGNLDEDGRASNNYFVSDTPAINGLTFASEARGITYQLLVAMPNTPTDFRMMRVLFMADGEVVEERKVKYGESIPYEEFPELPKTDEKFGVWENVDLSDIKQNTVVNAKYITWTTTIASAEPFPVMLLIGDFYTGTTLSYNKSVAAEQPELEGYEKIDQYNFTIDSEYGTITERYEARLLADEYEDADIIAVDDGTGIKAVETARDGRYMVFNVGEGDTFYVIRSKSAIIKRYIFMGICILAVVLFLGFILSRVTHALRGRKHKAGEETKEDDNKETKE